MSNFVRQVRAHESEIVEIAWTLKDGSVFHQRVTLPPKTVRESRNAAGQVTDRPLANESGQRYDLGSLDIAGPDLKDGRGKATSEVFPPRT